MSECFGLRDRVCRQLDVFKPKSPMCYGRVSRIGRDQGQRVYWVEWDGSPGVSSGPYFGHGLRPAVDAPREAQR